MIERINHVLIGVITPIALSGLVLTMFLSLRRSNRQTDKLIARIGTVEDLLQ